MLTYFYTKATAPSSPRSQSSNQRPIFQSNHTPIIESVHFSSGWFLVVVATWNHYLEVMVSSRRIPKGPGRRPKSLARREFMGLIARGWPFPNVLLMVSGGVTDRDVDELRAAGSNAVGINASAPVPKTG